MKLIHEKTRTKTMAFSKKIIFPFIALLLLLSCSKDDDAAPEVTPIPTVPSFLKVTIGGTPYKFDKFVVETQTVVEPDYTYVDLTITASIRNDETRQIIFNLEKEVPGPATIYYFYLLDNAGSEYDTDHESAFSTYVTVNSNKRIIGTFSGTLGNFNGLETVELQNGSFDISY